MTKRHVHPLPFVSASLRAGALLLSGALALSACGEDLGPEDGFEDPAQATPTDSQAEGLTITPRVELVGLQDLYADFELTHLDFTARLYLLPTDPDVAGVSTELEIEFDGEEVFTHLSADQLRLTSDGTYDVLMGIYPASDRASVIIGGVVDNVLDGELGEDIEAARSKEDGPEPLPNLEPVPMPARNPADNPGEAAEGESAEPVPMPARSAGCDPQGEPVPMPARGKAEAAEQETETFEDPFAPPSADVAEPVFVQSRRIFEFRVGRIQLTESTRELWVTWDVSDWLNGLIADAFGAPAESSQDTDPTDGFSDTTRSFELSSRE